MIYYVAKNGNDSFDGTKNAPFLTINRAASIAVAGDKIIVREGVYRECVIPAHGGTEASRITYTAAEGEKVIIKGSEIVTGWVREGDVWHITVENSMFGAYNPYSVEVDGDWLARPKDYKCHTGMVYLDGEALIESPELCGLAPMYWYAKAGDAVTDIYANFADSDPNNSVTEINVRRSCFRPQKTGRSYITVRGFEIAHAATTWSPPTAEQIGALTVNWAKGWIIENNIIHDSRTCGISIGKLRGERDNYAVFNRRKAGHTCQSEVVFAAHKDGWCRENIGSHIIRNNKIYDCGQNGIVGHLGGIFSEIYGNEIYGIGIRGEFWGYELGAIKLHALTDTYIHHNHIHHNTMGTWLDWQAQGIRLSSNIYHHNGIDIKVEAAHGPHIVDNNILGSEQNFQNAAQGGAYVNNIFLGGMYKYEIPDRPTPYHPPHSTEIIGVSLVYSGDDRYYNNIFVNTQTEENKKFIPGLGMYNGSSHSIEDYLLRVSRHGRGDVEYYAREMQPVYTACNYYGDGVEPYDGDKCDLRSACASNARISDEADGVYLEITLDDGFDALKPEVITTEKLGTTRITESIYDAPDGSSVKVDKDVLGAPLPAVGAVAGLKPGKNRVLLIKKK